ncbi:alkaline phosphatase D family protein [Alienimonas californiensis]|uniref:PhoD-like phosphatase n=1 Tax=Alienimonas californiensis TaxID=2527989 RepID=A0A517P6L5_9PLAN|nr:alkaline phosphatase D family protein [Alienimonas californiensis]QDT15009.1 PhoD-like phosphatase [Alienimonas californiensis]
MTRLIPLLLLAAPAVAHAAGFANGVKIGEVTPASAVLWVRLTADDEAGNPVREWTADAPNWTVPGLVGEVRFRIRANDSEDERTTDWTAVDGDCDYCHQTTVDGLEPDTRYQVVAEARSGDETATFDASFRTAPAADSEAPLLFTVSTCQEFDTSDDFEHGHRIYRSMLTLEPAFFVQTGDTLYYDRTEPLAKDMATARYRWNRMYAFPNFVAFHRRIPSYWMHDDHDLLKDDAWPGQTYGDLTWDQGLKIWDEQIPQSDKPYRSFRWGEHVEIWLPEGREFRSPNTMPDGPDKTIFGEEQWRWLETSMRDSDATFKLFLSATPVVGPDRDKKKDNHANAAFEHEGRRLRAFLNSVPGCFVINGDRHWQYHSVDAETGLNEFGCGPASDAHAGGWKQDDVRPEHRFLRVKGGFLSVRIEPTRAVVTHHDVEGRPVHETAVTR